MVIHITNNATFCAITQQCGDAITHIFYRPAEIWLNLIFTLVLWAICYLYGVNRKSIEERGRRGIPSADGSPGAPHIKSESWDTEAAAKPGKMTSHTVLSVAQILLAFRMKGTFQLFCFDCHSKLESRVWPSKGKTTCVANITDWVSKKISKSLRLQFSLQKKYTHIEKNP